MNGSRDYIKCNITWKENLIVLKVSKSGKDLSSRRITKCIKSFEKFLEERTGLIALHQQLLKSCTERAPGVTLEGKKFRCDFI
ncbi:unnamed protein product [Caretta caretta]